jgi:D-cysteine desulfhydrase
MKTLPRLNFAHLPTPVEPLPRLSAILGNLTLLVKRDDQTGLALGGNKTRKLEFLLADARAKGARLLITAGALQSNHCRQTAAAAARYGFDCTLVLVGDPPAAATANLLLDQLLGAQIVWATPATRDQVLQQTFDNAREHGHQPYLIPYGGSNATGGCLGFCHARVRGVKHPGRLDRLCFLLRRHPGRPGAGGAAVRLPGPGAGHQRGRAASRLAGACRRAGDCHRRGPGREPHLPAR